MTGEREPDEPFRPPLPMEDRLWRHPSELAASQRGTTSNITVSTVKSPVKQAIGLATLGAVGGALVVTGLFLTIGRDGATTETATQPVIQTLALDPIVPLMQAVPVDTWPTAVVAEVAPGIGEIAVSGPDGVRKGSGVLFRSDGFLLTSADLVRGGSVFDVALQDGSNYAGTLLGTDAISGLAVVGIDQRDTPTARLGIMTPPPQVGDYSVALPGLADSADLVMAVVSALSVNVPISENQNLQGL
ncbi:MAG: trypsin-like peptidase domain-containing protein, partial [Acidimicrobiales bacterium]